LARANAYFFRLIAVGTGKEGTEGRLITLGGTDEPAFGNWRALASTRWGQSVGHARQSWGSGADNQRVPTSGFRRRGRGGASATGLCRQRLATPLTLRVLLRCQAAGDQVLVRDLPHRARRLAAVPPGGAGRAVTALVGLVRQEHGAPALSQAWELGTCHRHERVGVGTIGQIGEHVEAFPYGIAENLPEDLIHLEPPLPFRHFGGFIERGPELAELASCQSRGLSWGGNQYNLVVFDEHGHRTFAVDEVTALHAPDELAALVPTDVRGARVHRRGRGGHAGHRDWPRGPHGARGCPSTSCCDRIHELHRVTPLCPYTGNKHCVTGTAVLSGSSVALCDRWRCLVGHGELTTTLRPNGER